MRTRTLFIVAALTFGFVVPVANASTWTNSDADDDWFNPNNWTGGDFTGGPGQAPDQSGSIGAAVGAVPLNFSATGATSLYMIVNNVVNINGGDLIYTGDGLWGSSIGGGSGGVGSATVTQTAGTITQTGGGAGFLIGHNVPGTYDISGGSVIVQDTSPSLCVDWTLDGAASASSILTINGNAVVDVQAPALHFGPQATLNVLDDGVLIWRNHTLADLAGDITIGPFTAPVTTEGAVINALPIQVGTDVHFVVPEPGTLALLGLGGLALTRRRRA